MWLHQDAVYCLFFDFRYDRMAQFYASFEAGHVTTSTALKRLTGHTEKNLFYHANLQMGRILKAEHILLWMSYPFKRKRTRKGLLKVEQIHQLARDITYGNRGRLKGTTFFHCRFCTFVGLYPYSTYLYKAIKSKLHHLIIIIP